MLAPIVNVFQTAGIFADEVDDRTLGYLLVRPIAREYILFGKALGAWFVGSVTLAAAAAVAHLPFLWRGDLASLGDGARLAPLAGFAGLLSISSAIYVGYALIAGILLKRPVLWSLGYAMIVEVAFAIFLDGPPARLAVSHHVSRLLPEAYRSPQEVLAAERLATLSETQPVAVLAGLGALALAVYAAAVFAVRRSEFPVKDD
ncbi:MAG: ABC transporter permease subunit [Planctomycetota bacterium]